jgi:phosphoglucomutase
VHYAGITAAPEIMAWARSINEDKNSYHLAGSGKLKARTAGFIYISASHNPIGHNGLKFGLTDGGVLAPEEALKLIAQFRAFFEMEDCIAKLDNLVSASDPDRIKEVYAAVQKEKADSYKAYFNFCGDVAYGVHDKENPSIAAAIKKGIEKNPLGIVCDFNGSARTVSADREFFLSLGLKFDSINSEPGQIVHSIVPEGEALEPCARLLEKARKKDDSFLLGYMPDCDGDRGNLVIWDENPGKRRRLEANASKARALEAQEVFALACAAELSHMVWTGELFYDDKGKPLVKAAIAINDPTSMRIDRIAEAFGVSVFRAEVGEANVVSLARLKREEGYSVRILGEGSAGGNITHPSAVRDPVNTVLAIVKFLSVRSCGEKEGFFDIWRKYFFRKESEKGSFSLADIIASMPLFVTTPSYNENAILRIKTQDHALLKDRYEMIFLHEWEERKDEFKKRFCFCSGEAIAYNGTAERRNLERFGDAGRGGLKILFKNAEGRETAFIWMRGSATEPVFRIMADVEGRDLNAEKFLLDWQRCMIMKADSSDLPLSAASAAK